MIIQLKRDATVFKKAYTRAGVDGAGMRHLAHCIVKLLIPAGTLVRLGRGLGDDPENRDHKCRAERARVLELITLNPDSQDTPRIAFSMWVSDSWKRMEYRVGEEKLPWGGFDTTDYICAPGIHFFWRVQRAVNYCFG